MPEELRTYRIVKLTHWSLAEINEASAVRLDELLKIDEVHQHVAADKTREPVQPQ